MDQLHLIKAAYRYYKSRYGLARSFPGRIFLILDFFDSLPVDTPADWLHPYKLELVPEIYSNLKQVSTGALPLNLLLGAENLLSEYIDLTDRRSENDISEMLDTVRKRIAFLYLCVVEYKKCYSYLSLIAEFRKGIPYSTVNNTPVAGFDPTSEFSGKPLDWMDKIEACENSPLPEIAREFKIEWKSWSEGTATGKAVILLVEQDQWSNQGYLKRLLVSVRKLGESGSADHIQINNSLPQGNDPMVHQAEDALTAIKTILPDFNQERLARYSWEVTLSFTDKQNIYSGNSLGLALGATIFSRMLEENRSWKRCEINQNTAFTGALNIQGKSLEVDEKGLAAKLEAVFYSPIKAVVLPDANITGAEKTLDALKIRHPLRHLELIPAGTLKELLKADSKACLLKTSSPVNMITERILSGSAFKAIMLAVFSVVIFISVMAVFSPKDLQPAYPIFQGRRLIRCDAAGIPGWDVDVGFIPEEQGPLSQDHYKTIELYGEGLDDFAILAANRSESIPCELILVDQSGRIRDRFPIGHNSGSADPYYSPYILKTDDLDNDGKLEIVTVALNHFTPCVINIVEPASLTFKEYIHEGHIYDFCFVAFENDSSKQIALCGTNTDFDQAVLILLNPSREPDDTRTVARSTRLPSGVETCYVRFPRSIWSSQFNVRRSHARKVKLLSGDILEVTVDDGDPDCGNFEVLFFFDRFMHLSGIIYPDVTLDAIKNIPALSTIQESDYLIGPPLYYNEGAWSVESGADRGATNLEPSLSEYN